MANLHCICEVSELTRAHPHTDSVPSFALCANHLMNSRSQFSSYFWLTLDLKGARVLTFTRICKRMCVCVCALNAEDYQCARSFTRSLFCVCVYAIRVLCECVRVLS